MSEMCNLLKFSRIKIYLEVKNVRAGRYLVSVSRFICSRQTWKLNSEELFVWVGEVKSIFFRFHLFRRKSSWSVCWFQGRIQIIRTAFVRSHFFLALHRDWQSSLWRLVLEQLSRGKFVYVPDLAAASLNVLWDANGQGNNYKLFVYPL